MSGLKNVRRRHTDALTQVRWDRLETMLADYYRAQGYAVDHCGTGNTRNRFDGGIDLKLRRDDAYILVQCKHWNAKQVPHNDVHQLIGLMVNEGATGAILVTSGEFTRAAVEAAAKHGHVQLVDGDDLRGMLGPLPDADADRVVPGVGGMPASLAHRAAATVGERLLSALEDRIRHGSGAGRGKRRWGSAAASAGLTWLLWKFIFAVVIMIVLGLTVRSALDPLLQPSTPVVVPQARGQNLLLAPSVQRGQATLPTSASAQSDVGGAVDLHRAPTAAEIRESQRKADEAIQVLAPTTPEM
jgi:hypothetical protein